MVVQSIHLTSLSPLQIRQMSMLITLAEQISMELANRAKSTLATLTVPMGRLKKRCTAKSIVTEENHMATAKIPMDSPL